MVSLLEVEISVQLLNSPLAIGLPLFLFHICLWSLTYLSRAFCFTIFFTAIATAAESFTWAVSLYCCMSFSRASLSFFILISLRAISLGHTKVRYSQRANPQMIAEGRMTPKRKYLMRKKCLPLVKRAARYVFSPLLSETPAVKRKRRTVCQMVSFLPFLMQTPVM